jgi:hypothetical protein
MARGLPARERDAAPARVAAAVVSAVALIVGAGACTSGRAKEATPAMQAADLIERVRCPEVEYVDVTAAPVPTSGLQALARLGRVESAPEVAPSHSGMSGMDHGKSEGSVSRVEGAAGKVLKSELRRAAEASCHLLTATAAEAAGYYLGSPYVEGVGTHWINWSLVDRPFDPARPSMLLFKTTGIVTQLAGFSYWVRSETEPAGFAGSADHWHRHSGLCFSAGQWAGEELAPSECDGVWLNGRDLWMLHAWVVPGHPNDAGVFAPRSRTLCRPNMPDIVACPRGT